MGEYMKGSQRLRPLGGSQEMQIINEAGLYFVITKSTKPNAKQFQKWVYQDVLPSLRKKGSYEMEKKYKFILESKEDEIKRTTQLLEIKNTELKDIKENIIDLEKQAVRRKRRKVVDGKVIYIIANKHFKNKYKLGISQNFTGRISTYNTHSADDFELIWYRKTVYNDILEITLKKTVSDKLYFKSKEWYDIEDPKILINKINKLIELYNI